MQLKAACEKVLNLTLPQKCTICKRSVKPFELLCSECQEHLLNLHQHGRMNIISLNVFYYGRYEGKLRELILSYKNGRWRLALFISKLFEKLFELYPPPKDAIITFIPSTPSSMEIRGYDHMKIVAKKLQNLTGVKSEKLLVISKDWHQSVKNKYERYKVENKFIASDKVKNRKVILIDDIVTTGNTIKDSVKALKKEGVSSIHVYVLAKVCR